MIHFISLLRFATYSQPLFILNSNSFVRIRKVLVQDDLLSFGESCLCLGESMSQGKNPELFMKWPT